MDISQPAQYNQAIIDFGAVICKSAQPLCNNCPFSSECKALNENRILELPVKSKKIIKKNRYFNYLVLSHQGKIYIQQRIEKDIWQFLFQFPNVEFNDQLLSKEELMKELSFSVSYIRESKIFLQTLTHRKIHAKFFEIECLDCIPPNDWILVSKEELNNYK